jgi:hypothetical protein
VAADLLGQLLPLVADVVGNCLRHPFILAYGTDDGGLRRTRGAVPPMSTDAPSTTAAPTRTTGPRLSPRTRMPRATDVGDARGHGRAGRPHHVELHRLGQPGADDAQRDHRQDGDERVGRGVQRPRRRELVPGTEPPPRQEDEGHLRQGHQHLGRGEGQAPGVEASQEAAHVGPPDAVAGGGHQHHDEPDRVRAGGQGPRLQDEEHPGEADRDPDEPAPPHRLVGQERQGAQHGGDRGGGVGDAGDRRADALLAERVAA